MVLENLDKSYWMILENIGKSYCIIQENIGKSDWMVLRGNLGNARKKTFFFK